MELKKERWGKNILTKGIGIMYNEKLVTRGETYISLDFIKTWEKEIEELNKNKVGAPFDYPNSFVKFSAFIHEIFRLPYRQLEGFFRRLSKFVPILKAAEY